MKRAARWRPPARLRWLFPALDVTRLDVDRDADQFLARILERGRMVDGARRADR